MFDPTACGLVPLTDEEMQALDGGDGYEAGLAVGRFLRRVGQAFLDAASSEYGQVMAMHM